MVQKRRPRRLGSLLSTSYCLTLVVVVISAFTPSTTPSSAPGRLTATAPSLSACEAHLFTPFAQRAGLVSPAALYNATTVASVAYQAHPPNGLSLVLSGRCKQAARCIKGLFTNDRE